MMKKIYKSIFILAVITFSFIQTNTKTFALEVTPSMIVLPPDSGGGYIYFSNMEWIMRNSVISLSLKPKTNIYSITGASRTPWEEVLYFGSLDSRWYNASGMKDQFTCHYDLVRLLKTPWNLEPSRPDKSYLETVLAGCNP